MVSTFIGNDQHKTVEENIALFQQIWPPIIALAEEQGVKIAIENCPMRFGADQWPAGPLQENKRGDSENNPELFGNPRKHHIFP